MSHNHIVKTAQSVLAVASLGISGLMVAAPAHAVNCTVNGAYLNLDHTFPRHSLEVQANGSTLGPGAVVSTDGINPIYGNATGSIAGNTVDFVIDWNDNKGQAHYSGTIGPDGIAKGTATGNVVPINLWNPGDWTSTGPLSCTGVDTGPAQPTQGAGTVTVKKASDVYDGPDGNGKRIGPASYHLAPGRTLTLVQPCADDWCLLTIPDAQVKGGQGWVYAGIQNGQNFLQIN
jgi:hypothetical protein